MEKVGSEVEYLKERREMVRQLREEYLIPDKVILAAMEKIQRHRFIPAGVLSFPEDAYGDHPCGIGYQQTISQPYIAAYMTMILHPKKGEKVLEIGTGSGYQAAILAELGAEVYSIEIVPELASHARTVLDREGYGRINTKQGDGYKGWLDFAPFDMIIVTCAPEEIPKTLIEQLNNGGRMVVPLGTSGFQRLVIFRKEKGKLTMEEDLPVRFVPMIHGK